MRTHGQAIVWGTHVEVGHISVHAGWYQPLKVWWAARQAGRRQAHLSTRDACWNAQCEAVRPLRAEPAHDMVAAQSAITVATILYGLQS
jgi:hypothetical protein